jgi:hypothetical protein
LSIFAGLSGLGSVYAENANFNIERVAVHWLRTSFDIAGNEDGGWPSEESHQDDQGKKRACPHPKSSLW